MHIVFGRFRLATGEKINSSKKLKRDNTEYIFKTLDRIISFKELLYGFVKLKQLQNNIIILNN